MFIAKLNPTTLKLGKIEEVDLSESYKNFHLELNRGIEDGRLYHDGKTLRISAVIFEEKTISVARICSLALDMSSGSPKGGDIEVFDSPVNEDTVEKNWMPVHRPSLYNPDDVNFDYLYRAGKTFTVSDKTVTDVGGLDLGSIRGGSQLIGLENGTMLGIVHQCVSAEYIRFASLTKEALFRRRYVHRFMQYDENGTILKVTDQFNFINKSIEFASGIAIHNDKLLVTFGAQDSSAHIASFPLKRVLSALRPPVIQTPEA
jgi:hypothetical protein